MSSIDTNTLRMINSGLDPEYYNFDGEGSSKRETLNLSEISPADSLASNSSVVFISRNHAKKDNAKGLSNKLQKNGPEIKANQTEHFKQFEKNVNFVCMWGKPIGVELDYEWKKNSPRFLCAMFVMVYTWFHILYTQYLHIRNGEFAKLVEVFAIYGIGFAVILTHVVNFKKYKEITALVQFTRRVCLQNITGTRADILKSRFVKINKINIFLSCAGLSCVGVFVGYPIKAFLIDGDLVSLMPIEITFLDQSTHSGFFIANVTMSIIGVFTVLVLLFVNLSFFTSIANYSMQVDMIQEDIKELDGYWSGTTAIPFEGYKQILLRNICRKQQDMNTYLNKIKEIYDGYIFLFFVFSYVSQIISMFEIVTNDWISGYGIAIGIFICHAMYCSVGTVLSIENERLFNTLQQFKWYNCDLHSKKLYLQLLISSMDFKELWIGPLAPLSVFTGTQIIKSMYSYYTIMLNSHKSLS